MEYNEAIANLLKFEGSKDAILAIETKIKTLEDSLKNYQNIETNAASLFGDMKGEDVNLTEQIKKLLGEQKTLSEQLLKAESENKVMKQNLNKTLLEKQYDLNSSALAKLIDLDKITWKDNKAFVDDLTVDKYIDKNLPEFKSSIINKKEAVENVQKLSTGDAKGETKDPVIAHINSLFSPSPIFTRS